MVTIILSRTKRLDKEFLNQKYVKEGLSCDEIANLIGGITRQGVWKALKRNGIPLRSKADAIFFDNGNKCKISQGYLWIFNPIHARNNNGYVKRATLILEEKIGRKLNLGEFPHHKDLNRLNDHPDNLEISTRRTHPTVHSLIKKHQGTQIIPGGGK